MRAKDEASLRALRAIKSAILLEKTSGKNDGNLTEDIENKLLQKLAKQRKESIEVFEAQNRADLADKEKEELAVIEQFLPEQMDEVAIKNYLELGIDPSTKTIVFSETLLFFINFILKTINLNFLLRMKFMSCVINSG